MRSRVAPSRTLAACLAGLLGVLGAGLLMVAATRPPSPPPAPSGVTRSAEGAREASPAPAPSEGVSAEKGRAGVEDRVTGLVLPSAPPLSVSVPRLHVVSRLVALGVDDRGSMEVPADPATAGWYQLGPTPGALGPAVIAGHVTWNQAPAVFFRLAEMRRGDVVEVGRKDRRVAVFEVTRVSRHAKSQFPTRDVFGGVDHAGLRLITCGGEFDRSSNRYSDNVVVFATLVSAHRGHPRR